MAMPSTTNQDTRVLLDFIHKLPLHSSAATSITPSQSGSYIEVAVALSSCFIERPVGPSTKESWNVAQRNIQEESLRYIRLVVDKVEGAFSSQLQFEVVLLPRLLRLLFSLERWNTVEFEPDVQLTPESLRGACLDTTVALLVRLGEDLHVRNDKSVRGWEILRDIVSRLIRILQELQTMPDASFPIVVNVVTEPYIDTSPSDPFKTISNDDPAVTLETQAQLLSFSILVLSVLSRTLGSGFSVACFFQAQTRTLLEIVGQYTNIVLSAPLTARTLPFYLGVAECILAHCSSIVSACHLQQHISRLLLIRLREGVALVSSKLDEYLVTLCRTLSLPIVNDVLDVLQKESWSTEPGNEGISLHNICYAVINSALPSLNHVHLEEIRVVIASMPDSSSRDKLISSIDTQLKEDDPQATRGSDEDAITTLRAVFSSMGIGGLVDIRNISECLGAAASIAASGDINTEAFLEGLAKLPLHFSNAKLKELSLAGDYLDVARALEPVEDSKCLRLLYIALAQAVAYDIDPWTEEICTEFAAIVHRGMIHASREVRLSAGHLDAAIISHLTLHMRVLDIDMFLDPLRQCVIDNQTCVRETGIVSLGLIGKISNDVALLSSLRILITQLGQKNVLIRGLTHLQLRSIAVHHKKSFYSLVSPFMQEIALLVIPNLTRSPSTVAEFCRLLSITPTDFISQTLQYSLPVLVCQRDTSALARIAQELNRSVATLLLSDSHVILAHAFLSANSDIIFDFIISQLSKDTHGGAQVNGETLVRSCVLPLVCELVCYLGDTEQMEGREAIAALEKVQRKVSQSASSRRLPSSASFLEPYLLGIMTHINDLLHDVRGRKAFKDKNKVLKSLGSFFNSIGPPISRVSNQAMATLQSTIKSPELSDASVVAWFKFIKALASRDIGPCIGPLSAALVSAWPQLSSAAQVTAQKTLEHCIVTNRAQIEGHIDKVVDLSLISAFSTAARTLNEIRQTWTQQKYLIFLLQRCAGENITVTVQSLLELQRYIAQDGHQFLQAVTSGDVFDPLVGRIMDVLLSAAALDGEDAEAAHLIAYEILGAIGAVDPDRFDSQSREKSFSILHNFEDDRESVEFAAHLIEELLVPSFRSTSDPRFQTTVGYAMQELARFCSFTVDLDKADVRHGQKLSAKLWTNFSQTVRDTVAPFRGSKFVAHEKDRPEKSFPLYPSQSSSRDWLQMWALHLISRVTAAHAKAIFSPCRGAMRGNDAHVALFLLPHIVLHILISGADADRDTISAEIVVVLEDLVTSKSVTDPGRRTFAAQTIFYLLDHLTTWVRHARQNNARSDGRDRRKKNTSHLTVASEERIIRVQSMLSSIDQDLMARAAFESKAYARALMSIEQQITDGTSRGDQRAHFERMHEIYSLLDEPDGMEGVSTSILSPSMEMQIRQHESTGRWTAAQSCWEVRLQRFPDDLSLHLGLLRCLRNLGHYDTLRTHIQGVLTRRPEWTSALARFEVESAWIVGDWKHVQTVADRVEAQTAESAIAQLLLSLHSRDEEAIETSFASTRLRLGAALSATGRGSYRQSYDAVMNLHIVQELDLIHSKFGRDTPFDPIGPTAHELGRRFDSVLPTFRTQESLLNMRRTAFDLSMRERMDTAPLNQAVGQAWLETAKIARKAGHYQTAYSAILQAVENRAAFSYIQSCKLTKDNGDSLRALHELTAELSKVKGATGEEALDEVVHTQTDHQKKQLAKAMVLRARWMQETARFSYNDVSKQFGAAILLCKEWESSYFHFGYYQDECQRHLTSDIDKIKSVPQLNFQTVQNYALSLEYGSKYIYQTMPRLLTLWLDLGEEKAVLLADSEGRILTPKSAYFDLQRIHFRMNTVVKSASSKVAVYKWLTSFPQLISRVEHANKAVAAILLGLIVKVISAYPQQGLWSFISVRQSKNAKRTARCEEVLSQLKALEDKGLTELVNTSVSMAQELLDLCNFQLPDSSTRSMRKDFPNLIRVVNMTHKLILPLQESMTAAMPPRNATQSEHQPFPNDLPVIHGFKDEIEVMKSQAKPRKIVIIASDGDMYPMMAKPNDDLRKDARLMDFNTIINKLLKTNSESRRRQLHIRTYGVVPLSEESGIVQWVPNTIPLRPVLVKGYGDRGIQVFSPKVTGIAQGLKEVKDVDAGRIFTTQILPMFPPVFHEWFLAMFPDPSAWLAGRSAYSRTAAVISIVGAMLGLGDRHSENILLDILSGDVVHVDFNCLFERGKLLDVPERVPFRLTQNLVDGMGVTGVEGSFRIACEIVMRLLRDYKDCLMNVLEAFVHDPLVEWVQEKTRKERQAHRNANRGGQRADKPVEIKAIGMQALQLIRRKLGGMQVPEDFTNDKVISPTDQVAHLISEASSPQNLGKMYHGWAAWL